MNNTLFANGQMYPMDFATSYETAYNELKELLSAGSRPEEIEIYWYDEQNDYHDFFLKDGQWFHRHDVKRTLYNKIFI